MIANCRGTNAPDLRPVLAGIGGLLIASAGACSQDRASEQPGPLAEPGYPWPGTEDVVRKEPREGPLQQGFPLEHHGGAR